MAEIEDEPTARRLRAIKLAQELDNVAEACRRTGLDRTSFYKWKRRYEALGEDGLVDRPSRHHYHPQSASDVVVSRIADMAINHPHWGCNRIERQLAADGHVLSSASIQKILYKAGLATRRDRWRVLDQPFKGPLPFSAEQMRFLRQLNPCWRDRGAAGAYPGEFLVNGAFLLTSRDRKRIFVHCAVDVLTSVARAHVWYFRETDRASACLEDLCKYFQRHLGLPDTKRCTTYGFESWSRAYIRWMGWKHKRFPSATRAKIGAFERFHRTVLDEFQIFLGSEPSLTKMTDLNEAMDAWILRYNETRPFLGFPNYSLPPAQAAQRVSKEG